MTRSHSSTRRELSAESVRYLAEALAAYLERRDNRGASTWLDNRDLAPADRAAVLVALGDLEAADAA